MYWACARTEVRREAVAARFLEQNGYEVYLPRVRAQRRMSGRQVAVHLPLFPTYCFFRVESGWHSARWTVAIVEVLMDGERPARLADAIVDEIKLREGRDGLIKLPPRLKRGDPVRIKRGPFTEQLALYQEQAAHERIAVLLSLFNSQRRLTLREGDVEAV